jgi:uncharacterized protein (DUF1919 family)
MNHLLQSTDRLPLENELRVHHRPYNASTLPQTISHKEKTQTNLLLNRETLKLDGINTHFRYTMPYGALLIRRSKKSSLTS